MVVIVVFLKNRDDRTFLLHEKYFNSLSYDFIDIRYNLNEPNRCSLETKR